MNSLVQTSGRVVRWLLAVCLCTFGAATALAAGDPVGITTTLEGCRNNGGLVLPNGSGKYVCADAAYTSGNLGKGWNELDLVPYRLTLSAGNSAPPTQTYTIAVAVDALDAGKPGYDVLSTLTLNTALSSPSCSAATVGPQTALTPGLGGIDESLARLVTVTQLQNTTCVYDYFARLALGSHLFPGSSLHANLTNQTFGTAGVGASDVPIPVKEILPQSIAKDMTATQGSDHAWSITKSPSAASLSFGDVCRDDAPSSLPVSITVTWTKLPAVPGGPITVITHVYATNPASRTITTNVTDVIYSGTTPIDTSSPASVDVPANTTQLVLTHTYLAPAGTTNLNDIATASYTDPATGVPVPGTTTATASAPVQQTGPELNASAVISDREQISGSGLSFSVAAPSVGGFVGYTAGTATTAPVDWAVTDQNSGSITFAKTVYLAGRTVTSGTLADVASVAGLDNGPIATSNPVSIGITSGATVKFFLLKTIPVVLASGQSIQVKFHVSSTTDASFSLDRTLTFGPGQTLQSTLVDGLAPGVYVVEEGSSTFFYSGGPAAGVDAHLTPVGGAQKVIDLALVDGVATRCTGRVSYQNQFASGEPKAQVQKLTLPAIGAGDPDYNWTFTLTGPGLGAGVSKVAGANAGFVDFGVALNSLGTYTVTETQKAPLWVLTSAVPDPTAGKVCTFEISNLDLINGTTKQCTFTNTKQGKGAVAKTVQGALPSGAQAFTFQLRQGASPTSDGTILDTQIANAANLGMLSFSPYLVPGATYQICEVVQPGWSTTLGTFVPNAFNPPDGVATNPNADNSILCADFTVSAGETKTFTVDNSPPPGGRALTIGFWKNHASCKKSNGKQEPVLDQTLAAAEPTGIQVDSFYLHGSTANAGIAPDCAKAVSLLNKESFDGTKKASDPLFNMTAQLVAAELNYVAGAYKCPAVNTAIAAANTLLTKYGFNGTTYAGKLSAADASLANSLAKRLDDYNNDRPAACL